MSPSLIAAFLFAHLLVLVATPPFAELLRKRGGGQNIRSQGPPSHQKKKGTPTMGGVVLLAAFFLTLLLFSSRSLLGLALALAFASYLLLGLLDDWLNLKQTKALGLPARYKIAIQILLALLLSALAQSLTASEIILPWTAHKVQLSLMVSLPLYLLVFVATTNAVNLSDGLDGLAPGLLSIAFATLLLGNLSHPHLALPLAALAGATTGFLWLNFYPARIFLGNAGAMGLGGVLAMAAILAKEPLHLPIFGIVFVLEALSVILQVSFYRRTKKRLFTMSPIHHHFELEGNPEPAVVVRFWLFALFFSALSLL